MIEKEDFEMVMIHCVLAVLLSCMREDSELHLFDENSNLHALISTVA